MVQRFIPAEGRELPTLTPLESDRKRVYYLR